MCQNFVAETGGMEPTNILVNFQILPDQLDLRVGILCQRSKSLLNRLNLLRNSTQNSLFQPIEFVETTPSANLAQANEYTAHGLEIECFVATKDKNKSTQLYAKGLHRLSFP
jgi:hypothetical protein